ncbi:MAG TPA: aldehyde reductase [Anaerolineales bacterium]|nr:aldehyde reductase [Anaerolineales bacterium]HNB88613.1 aldehyde reductase [Anaerolineales bacterium]HNE67446.1 aldehyde reductase [Anaerolineales bacterium]HNF36538.1 aldehyde reductase [Anaerolineales bacterium]HNH79302.1 aldehyde reductase [Anaerolineales bacterium]
MTPSSPILVTGASGFVAIHTVIQLLQQGYNVRGTIRSLSKEADLRKTISNYVQANDRLEILSADLSQDAGWDEAMQNVETVLHVASPFPLYEPKHEDELIVPAVQGTLRVLRAAHKAGVKRMVQVSSVAAISSGHNGENKTFSEADWSDLTKDIGAYAKSKTLAERAAWDFIHGSENTNKMQLTTINPPLILGPVPNKDFRTSIELVRTIMLGQVPGVGRIKMGSVDVRDVASALILAMQTPEAAGQRILVAADRSLWLKEIAELLHGKYAGRYKINKLEFPSILVRLIALFDKKVARVTESLDWDHELSNENAKRILKWTPRSAEEGILSMAESLIEQGVI